MTCFESGYKGGGVQRLQIDPEYIYLTRGATFVVIINNLLSPKNLCQLYIHPFKFLCSSGDGSASSLACCC
uniref:Uncharacterized protein n=1 Tax=Setaria italica TaxID=4555 RepID=K3Z225_SETIT